MLNPGFRLGAEHAGLGVEVERGRLAGRESLQRDGAHDRVVGAQPQRCDVQLETFAAGLLGQPLAQASVGGNAAANFLRGLGSSLPPMLQIHPVS